MRDIPQIWTILGFTLLSGRGFAHSRRGLTVGCFNTRDLWSTTNRCCRVSNSVEIVVNCSGCGVEGGGFDNSVVSERRDSALRAAVSIRVRTGYPDPFCFIGIPVAFLDAMYFGHRGSAGHKRSALANKKNGRYSSGAHRELALNCTCCTAHS